MPKRSYSGAGSYRYGFNGKENDNDIKGLGNQQDYGMRIYDVRLGKFLSVDPITKDYPQLTPYHFAGNTPIWATDLDGLEPNFSNAKLPRQAYTDYGQGKLWNIILNNREFSANAGASAYNGIIDLAETGVSLFSEKGRERVMNETINPAFSAIVQWEMMNPEQRLMLLKQIALNPETWENIVGGIGAAFSGRFIPSLKLPKFFNFTKASVFNIDDILDVSKGIKSRHLLEDYALSTKKYKNFLNANKVIKNNNTVFDLFDKAGNVVDVTSTTAKSLNARQFTKKLDALANLQSANTRTLQIYVKQGQYSSDQLGGLAKKLQEYIKVNNLRNTNFLITEIK